MKFEGELIYGEKNGKGKEYDNDGNLIFDGQYFKGVKFIGRIKEYSYNGDILFEGEYLNGKRNGKEYNYDGKLIFEGEYLKGERNGKGKEFYINDNLRYEGTYLNGKKWNGKGYNIMGNIEYEIIYGKGYIKEYNKYGELIFEGEYLNGERNEKGKERKFPKYGQELHYPGMPDSFLLDDSFN